MGAPEPATTRDATEADPGEGSEAARYRRRLRATETERDALRGQLATLQRAEVERVLANTLAAPADVWVLGADLADFLDAEGNVDAAAVTTYAAEVVAERPTWRVRAGGYVQGGEPRVRTGPRGAIPLAGPNWSDVLRGG